MLKFLATGDLQVHKWRQFAYTTKSGRNSRFVNCLKVLSFCRKTALERGIKKLLINGDILEEVDYIDLETFNGVYEELEKNYDAGLETVLNLGNHDIYGESSGRVLHALQSFRKIATVVEKPTLLWDRVQVVPWMAPAERLKTAIRDLVIRKGDCLALHCGVQGAVTGPKNYLVRNPIKLPDIRFDEFALVLLSDYHTRQRLARRPPVWYMGSPLQHTFGEIHKPCIWGVFLSGREEQPRLEKIYTEFPRFRRVHASTLDELRAKTKTFAGDYVKVYAGKGHLSDQAIERVAAEIGFRLDIDRKDELEVSSDDAKSVNLQSAMCSYVWKNVKSKSHGEKLLKLGWRIFNGEV